MNTTGQVYCARIPLPGEPLPNDIQTVPARSLIHPSKPTNDYISRDYNMNIYRGCSHGCVYCDSRSECYHIEQFDKVRPKADALSLIDRDLRAKRRRGLIGTGAMSDPYNPLESALCLTRGALALADKHRFGISLTTKSTLVTRDIDLYTRIRRHSAVDIRLTITTSDDALCRLIEPNTPPSSERFHALKELARAGLSVGVFITPVLPYVTDTVDNVLDIVSRAIAIGVTSIVMFPGMTLRTGNREYYYAALNRHFPGLAKHYQSEYGDRYELWSPRAEEISSAFVRECESAGILHDFPSINRMIRAMDGLEQMSLI